MSPDPWAPHGAPRAPLRLRPAESAIAASVVLVLLLGLVVARLGPAGEADPPVVAPAPSSASASPSPSASPSLSPSPSPSPTPAAAPVRRSPSPPTVGASPAPVLVPISGRVLDGAGRPLAGAVVLTRRHLSGAEQLFGAFAVLATFGLACFAGLCDDDTVRGVTGADGRFRLRLAEGSDVGARGDHDLEVGLPGPDPDRPRATTSARYEHTGAPQVLPDLRLWTPALRAGRSGGEVRLEWPPLPAAYGDDVEYDAAMLDGDGAVVLRLPTWSAGRVVDGRLVERGIVTATLSARARDAAGRPVVYSGGRARVPDGPVPLSRGGGCLGYGPQDRPVPLSPCRWTDGDLVTEAGRDTALGDLACQDSGGCTRNNSAVRVDLRAVRDVSAVVLRGCTFDCEVEVSTDGRAFRRVAATAFGHDEDVLVELPPATRARFVRVWFSFAIDLTSGREVSVF